MKTKWIGFTDPKKDFGTKESMEEVISIAELFDAQEVELDPDPITWRKRVFK